MTEQMQPLTESSAEAPTSSHDEGGAGSRTLGLERYVQFAFLVVAIASFWFLDNLIVLVWNYIAEPDETIASAVAAIGGAAIALGLYKTPSINRMAFDVAAELAKVVWPNRKETWSATVVVLVTSVIAALMLGFMDTIWSAATDFIYTRGLPLD